MRNWRTVSSGLVLVMLTLVVVMVWRIVSLTEQTTQFDDRLKTLNANTIQGLIDEVRELSKARENPNHTYLLFQLLIQQAMYFPDDSVGPLAEAFISWERVYWDYEMAREIIGPTLAFAYLYAGLPAQLDEWQAQVIVHEPQLRYRVRFLQAAGKLLSDDLLAARQLVDRELETGASTPRGKAFALLCNVMLEDYEAAQAIELDDQTIASFDFSQQHAYAELLMFNGEFETAISHYIAIIEEEDSSPERHLELAVPMAALSGINHPQVRDELMIATTSTRYQTSLAGAEAMVIAELLRYGVEGNWKNQLRQFSQNHPSDFWVQATYLEAQLHEAKLELLAPPAGQQKNLPAQFLTTAPELMALAQTEHDQQWACLLLASAEGYAYFTDSAGNANGLEASLMYLNRALGDPQTVGSIASTRIPDYDVFVLDPIINQLRSADLDYNAGVNHAIVDYLRRVQERYADAIEPLQLEYRIP